MQKIKKQLKNSGKPLQEFSNRLNELNQIPPDQRYLKHYPIVNYSKFNNNQIISHLEFNSFKVFTKKAKIILY